MNGFYSGFIKYSAKIISEKPVHGEGEIIFQHQSPHLLDELSPLTYDAISKFRNKKYMEEREKEEDWYREQLGNAHEKDKSFLYSTILGRNKMEAPDKYPGYTYYFKIPKEKIKDTFFSIVGSKDDKDPLRGEEGLRKVMEIWDKEKKKYKSKEYKDLGITVHPRIEVVSPSSVVPEMYIPQVEDR